MTPAPDPAFPGLDDNARRLAAYAAARQQHRQDYPPVSREELARLEAAAPARETPAERLDASPASFLGALPR